MKPKEIQKLIEIVESSSVNELEVSRWGKKVIIRKNTSNHSLTGVSPDQVVVAQPASAPTASQPAAIPPPVATPVQQSAAQKETDSSLLIRSPMVGTFYRAPAPDAAPYVNEGEKVTKGQVVCIIEAMKLMNEIEAEEPCKIVEILVENAQPVEYDQPLFRIEKM